MMIRTNIQKTLKMRTNVPKIIEMIENGGKSSVLRGRAKDTNNAEDTEGQPFPRYFSIFRVTFVLQPPWA
jgi:hypothetical protein